MKISEKDYGLLKQCSSKQEVIKLVKENHLLTDEQLDSVSGGDFFDDLWEKIKEKGKEIIKKEIDEESPNTFR